MSIDRRMGKEDVAYSFNGILLTPKNEIMPFAATWMDMEVILSKVSQRKTNIIWYYLYVESKKSDTNKLI